MNDYGQMQDLLRNQRRRRGLRRRSLQFVTLIVLLGAGVYAWMEYDGGVSTPEKRRANAASVARGVVGESVEAARLPIEVDAPEEPRQTEDEARTAEWSEGESVELRGTVAKNQSIFEALRDRNVPLAKIQKAVSATEEEFDFRRSRPGDEWFAEVDESGQITRLRYQTSPEDIWETVRNSKGKYSCSKLEVPVERRETVLSGTVEGSLWEAIVDEPKKSDLVYRFADIFAYTVDFNRETRPGDKFAMIVEKVHLEGDFLRYGDILAAEYVNSGEQFRGFNYETEDGDRGYYNPEGKNLKRQFLKSPLASIRVTSRYGMRYHPVVGRKKMHRGVDYGAPVGTPIRAVADGTVQFAGRKGANGNLIVLRHANGYVTMYAHLNKISDGIRPGAKVTKKTVIGTVGSTGRSTGPHLHFGMKRDGRYINPMEVEFARAEPLEGDELERFRSDVVEPLTERLESETVGEDPVNLAESDGESGEDEAFGARRE